VHLKFVYSVQRDFESYFFTKLHVPEAWWTPLTTGDGGKMLHVAKIEWDFGMHNDNPMSSQNVYSHKAFAPTPSRLSKCKVNWSSYHSSNVIVTVLSQIRDAPMQYTRCSDRAACVLYDDEHMIEGETVESVRARVEQTLEPKRHASAVTVTPKRPKRNVFKAKI
jgi:hypothetical protein